MDYKTALITGGAGFVGSNLSIDLKSNHNELRVIAFDNLKRRGSELNIKRLKSNGVEFVHGDIRNPEDLSSIGEVDLLLECSAEPSVVSGYGESPSYLINTNLIGSINCLELVRKYSADIVFLSSSRVYPIKTINSLKYIESDTRFDIDPYQDLPGITSEGIDETFPIDGTRSLYGATKLCSEFIIQEYIEMYNIRGIINRCGVLTGPWQMGKVDQGVVVLWVAKHLFKGSLGYFGYGGTGKQVRDILHINDLYKLLDNQIKEFDRHNGCVYNVGGGTHTSVSLMELTALCEQVTGNRLAIESVEENRIADIPYYITNNQKITEASGWMPRISVREIVEDIANWINENMDDIKPILS